MANQQTWPHFIAQLPALHGKAVLDIGCGAGDFAAHCVQYGAIYVTGVDISANMIELAIKRHTHDEKLHFKRVAFDMYFRYGINIRFK